MYQVCLDVNFCIYSAWEVDWVRLKFYWANRHAIMNFISSLNSYEDVLATTYLIALNRQSRKHINHTFYTWLLVKDCSWLFKYKSRCCRCQETWDTSKWRRQLAIVPWHWCSTWIILFYFKNATTFYVFNGHWCKANPRGSSSSGYFPVIDMFLILHWKVLVLLFICLVPSKIRNSAKLHWILEFFTEFYKKKWLKLRNFSWSFTKIKT